MAVTPTTATSTIALLEAARSSAFRSRERARKASQNHEIQIAIHITRDRSRPSREHVEVGIVGCGWTSAAP